VSFAVRGKPLDQRYDFELFERALDGLLATLDVEEVALVGHDLGGPIGLHWALGRPGRVTKLALLNTLVYPEFSKEVIEFVRAFSTPEGRDRMTRPEGLEAILRLGLADGYNPSDEFLAAVRGPFQDEASRAALASAAIQLRPQGFAEIAHALPHLDVPVRILYGVRDRLLPDIAETVARLERDLPQAAITPFPDNGHFVQEEAPEEVGELLADFFAG
jgi:pimeloyl-ACP methyl ester carboxylesterase